MPNRYRIRGVIAALLLTAGVSGGNGLAAQTGAVSGVITDAVTGRPLNQAVVGLAGTTKGQLTDTHGRFLIERVPEGAYTLRIRMIGYGAGTAEITVEAGSTVVADVQLEAEIAVEAVSTVVVDFRLEADAAGRAYVITCRVPRLPRTDRKIGVSLPVIDAGDLAAISPPGGFLEF